MDTTADPATLTVVGLGAYVGLPKPFNGGELNAELNAPAQIVYDVTALTATAMTLDIHVGHGWWRYELVKVTTCDDSTQNGDETGVDCGGSCTACATGGDDDDATGDDDDDATGDDDDDEQEISPAPSVPSGN